MFSNNFLLIFLTLYIKQSVCNVNKSISGTGFNVDFLGESGIILITSSTAEKNTLLEIQPGSIKEYDSFGEELPEHSINNLEDVNFGLSEPVDEVQYGISSSIISLTKTLPHQSLNAEFSMELIIFKNSGHITSDSGELYEISPGAIKMNIHIRDWDFCGAGVEVCKKGNEFQVGQYLDIALKINGGPSIEKNGRSTDTMVPQISEEAKAWKGSSISIKSPQTYDLYTSYFVVSPLLRIDSTWRNMTKNYPKIELINNKTTFTFRFPRFAGSVHYQTVGIPIINHITAGAFSLKNQYWFIFLSVFIVGKLLFL